VNVDFSASGPGVIAHDLRRGLPFADESFVAAYGSHVLEHLDPDAGERLLRECHRVLAPGGIVRIVVPDLEAIARLYLESLEAAAAGNMQAEFRHEWATLELLDQSVRTRSGGRMAVRLANLDDHGRLFVESRIGREAVAQASGCSSADRVAARRVRAAWWKLRTIAAGTVARLFFGSEGAAALREGLFRRSGEVHQYMYDRFSLKRALERAGFVEAQVRDAASSRIPGFSGYGLDVLDGRPRKPDSLYLEARKPGAT
jgi:predicted SAM-dependent methyltransferase